MERRGTRFGKIIAAGLLFSLSFALLTGAAALAGRLSGYNNIFVRALGIIFAAPLYAGFVGVVKQSPEDDGSLSVVRLFFASVAKKWKLFSLLGIAAYLVTACSFFAVFYYSVLVGDNPLFIIALAAYSLFAQLLLMALMLTPLFAMDENRFRDVIARSFRAVFSNFPRVLLAALSAELLCAAAAAGFWFSGGVLRRLIAAAAFLILPTAVTLIDVLFLSPLVWEKPEREPAPPEEDGGERLAELAAESDSDYIFINGRMVKNPNKGKGAGE